MSGISKIMIEQQLGAIGIETTPAQMHIAMNRLKMKIKTEEAKMDIEHQNPTFKINRKKLNSDMGLKLPGELIRQYRDNGRAGALRAAKTAAQDGDFLADVTKPGNRVVQLARSKTRGRLQPKKINIGLMPKDRPEIKWDKGYLRVNWSKHSIAIDWEGEYLPELTIDPPYSIEVFLRTKPYFRLTVEEGEDPYQPGRIVDEVL